MQRILIVQSTSQVLHSPSRQNTKYSARDRLGPARDCTLTRLGVHLQPRPIQPGSGRIGCRPSEHPPPIVVIFCANSRFFPGENPKVAKSRSKSSLQPPNWKTIISKKNAAHPPGLGVPRLDFDLDFATLKISRGKLINY